MRCIFVRLAFSFSWFLCGAIGNYKANVKFCFRAMLACFSVKSDGSASIEWTIGYIDSVSKNTDYRYEVRRRKYLEADCVVSSCAGVDCVRVRIRVCVRAADRCCT